ncbi:COG4705 family protein [Streptomyces sp. NPDC001100]
MKVPEISRVFWIAKLCTTGFESFSDYVFFNDSIGQHLAMLLGLGLLLACLAVQITTRRYIPWVYWLAVTAVSIFGTMSADFLNKDLEMPLYASTLMLVAVQAGVFAAWYATQRTLDVHSIDNRLRELFYWLTVLCTFALGTAAGDFAAVTLGLGTLAASFVFLGIILIPAAGYRWFGLNEVLAFWFAYTITRPLGASVADWLSVPVPYGDGLQWGTWPISLVLGILLAGVVALIDSRHRRTTPEGEPARFHPAGTRQSSGR